MMTFLVKTVEYILCYYFYIIHTLNFVRLETDFIENNILRQRERRESGGGEGRRGVE